MENIYRYFEIEIIIEQSFYLFAFTDIIKPVVSVIISVSATVGLIGLSFQIALLNDLITLASLHCYCFYVYAAR